MSYPLEAVECPKADPVEAVNYGRANFGGLRTAIVNLLMQGDVLRAAAIALAAAKEIMPEPYVVGDSAGGTGRDF